MFSKFTFALSFCSLAAALRPSLNLHLQSEPFAVLSGSSPRAHNFSVPIDHFHNDTRYEPHSNESFPLRYWFDDKYYKPGGPVIVLAAGETTAEVRLPFLEYGIVQILAEATGGLGVVLEHRYYGTSYPVPNLSTENMRFLTTEQALADTNFFAQNIVYPGLEEYNLTSSDAPYVIYGGSYAGVFAAFARKIYPDTFWGAISSSGVTVAIDDYWEYFEAARLYSPKNCAEVHMRIVAIIDAILLSGDGAEAHDMKSAFGLQDLSHEAFAEITMRGLEGLQSVVWDPAVSDTSFAAYCAILTSGSVVYPDLAEEETESAQKVAKVLRWSGYNDEAPAMRAHLSNFIGYIRASVAKELRSSSCKDKTVRDCFKKEGQLSDISIPQGLARPWIYQTCTQWGYFLTGASVPEDRLPMISRFITYESATTYCRDAFNISARPDVESVNRLGGFNFSYPRVAIIDGEADPWRQATPHAIGHNEERKSSTEYPFVLIEGGATHHWDEFGLPPRDVGRTSGVPPTAVQVAQQQMADFVKEWVQEWRQQNDIPVNTAETEEDFVEL